MNKSKREQAVELIGEEKVKELESASKIWTAVWTETAYSSAENCFPCDHFLNYLGFSSQQIDLQNALCELNSKGIDLNIAPIRSEWMECEPVDLDP